MTRSNIWYFIKDSPPTNTSKEFGSALAAWWRYQTK